MPDQVARSARQSYKEASMFREGLKIPPFQLCVIMRWAGLGDCIQRMPALFYMYDNAPHVSMYVFVYDYLQTLFEHTFRNERDRIHIMPISAYEGWVERDWCKSLPYVDYTPKQVSASKTHLTEYGFMEVLKRVPQRGELWNIPKADLTEVDISKYNLPKDYGVLTTGVTSPVRAWPPQETMDVAKFMLQIGITPVYLGKTHNDLGKIEGTQKTVEANFSEEAIHPKGIDLRGSTGLLEALKVISEAKFIAGVDNGLLNLAYMTDTPVIAGYTSIRPVDRVPYRNGVQFDKTIVIEPDENLECKFCETLQPYVALKKHGRYVPHDYKHCIYRDAKCTTQMRAAKFIAGIKQVLNWTKPGSRQGKVDDVLEEAH